MDLEEQINFTNKRAHPTNPRMVVFRHAVKEQAEYFAELLVENSVDFEAQVDEDHDLKPMYFGVSKKHEKLAGHLNYVALGKNRAKFVDSAPIRWIMFFITALFVGLALVGAVLSN
jgi:hypothetical protein